MVGGEGQGFLPAVKGFCRMSKTAVPVSVICTFNKYPSSSSTLDTEKLTGLWEIVIAPAQESTFKLLFYHWLALWIQACSQYGLLVLSMCLCRARMTRTVASVVCCGIKGNRKEKVLHGVSSYYFSISFPS